MLRLCELAAVVAIRPRLLLLDEPSSGIAQKETEALGPLLKRLAQYLGATVILIEHDMPLVMSLSDRIVAMAAGAVITTGTPAEVRAHPEVLQSYLGASGVSGAPLLDAPLLEAWSLDVHYGRVQVPVRRVDRGGDRRVRRAARHQRRRQVDVPQGGIEPLDAVARRDPLRGPRHHRPGARSRSRRPGWRTCRAARHAARPHRRREPAARRPPAAARARRRDGASSGRSSCSRGWAPGAPARRHAVGRRAADARHRPGAGARSRRC